MNTISTGFIYNNPTKIFFGIGKLGMLHTEPLPGKKALLLTSSGKSYKTNGSFEKTIEELKISGIEYVHLANVSENPLKENCEEAGKVARENNCDFIIALGGGAVLDSAVPAAIMATNEGDLWDYVAGGTGKGQTAPNKPLPIVTIATTSGTGSEINECAVISREDTKEKIGIADRRCKPVLAVVDPTYMKSVPPKYTAFQGFDAFAHHSEVLMSSKCNIMSEMIALDSIARLYKYLPIAIKDGSNETAREQVAFAATMSGITMQLTRITAQHSIEHALSAYHRNLQHGAGLILVAVEYARFFLEKHACDERYIKMARIMGYPNSQDPEDYIKALIDFKEKCGMSELKMSDYGISRDELCHIPQAARKLQVGGFEVTPCELSDDDVLLILNRSYS